MMEVVEMKAALASIVLVACLVLPLQTQANEPLDDLLEALQRGLVNVGWSVFTYIDRIRIRVAINYQDAVTWHVLSDQVKPENRTENCTMAKICDIWDYCYSNWTYSLDPSVPFDHFSPASKTIAASLRGDCDDFAILVASGVRVAGGTGYVVCQSTAEAGHAFTLVYLGLNYADVVCNLAYVYQRYDLDEEWIAYGMGLAVLQDGTCWLNLDWSSTHPGGPFWADPTAVATSFGLPTPSVLGLLLDPILNVPTPPWECLRHMKQQK